MHQNTIQNTKIKGVTMSIYIYIYIYIYRERERESVWKCGNYYFLKCFTLKNILE